MQHRWTEALIGLGEAWMTVRAGQIADLRERVLAAEGDPTALAILPAPRTDTAIGVLTRALHDHAREAAGAMAEEAQRQGVLVTAEQAVIDTDTIASLAASTAHLLAGRLAQSAASRAVAAATGKATPVQIADTVVTHLTSLADKGTADGLRRVLTAAQNVGRFAIMAAAPRAERYVASEILDTNTCDPCEQVDGTVYPSADDAADAYPNGKFIDCEGWDRCRGTVIALWDEPTEPPSAEEEYRTPGPGSLMRGERSVGDPYAADRMQFYDWDHQPAGWGEPPMELRYYSSPGGYAPTQAAARGQSIPIPLDVQIEGWTEEYLAEVRGLVQMIDEQIARHVVNEPVTLWRTMQVSDDVAAQFVPGASIVNKGFVSTSCVPERAIPFGLYGETKPVAVSMKVLVPPGAHAAPSDFNLAEWVLPRGTSFRVRSAKRGMKPDPQMPMVKRDTLELVVEVQNP